MYNTTYDGRAKVYTIMYDGLAYVYNTLMIGLFMCIVHSMVTTGIDMGYDTIRHGIRRIRHTYIPVVNYMCHPKPV